ncbi:MAG: cytochrome c family protein [Hyphomicrobiales bacterium]|nr:MAG: cytochrome c family protein [Hyphomicrobiales bacterium]
MDFFEINKFAGAILGTVLGVLGLGYVADFIFHHEMPEKPGFVIEVAGEETAAAEEEKPAEEAVPFATLLANADLAAGEKQMSKCKACHTWEKGGPNRVGPNLYEIVGRTPGTHADFSYSAAMAEFGQSATWDYETLNTYLTNPKEAVPGNKMSFAGFKKDTDRANVIGFLRTMADSPAPLPSAEAPAEAAPAAEAPAEAAPAEAAPAAEAPAEAPAEAAPAETTAPATDLPSEPPAAVTAPAQ